MKQIFVLPNPYFRKPKDSSSIKDLHNFIIQSSEKTKSV